MPVGKHIPSRSPCFRTAGWTNAESSRFFAIGIAAFHDSAGNVFATAAPGANAMLFIVFLCLLLWFLGFMTTTTLGGALHVLLIIAVVFLLLHVIQGRPIGD